MAEWEISQGDIIGLGDAFDALLLPEPQKALLSALVALAAGTIANRFGSGSPRGRGRHHVLLSPPVRLSFTPGALAGLEAAPGGPTKVVIGQAFKIGRDVDG